MKAPTIAEVDSVARAIALSEPGINPQNPPLWPRDYSIGEISWHRAQAYAAIAAMQSFLS